MRQWNRNGYFGLFEAFAGVDGTTNGGDLVTKDPLYSPSSQLIEQVIRGGGYKKDMSHRVPKDA